MRVLLPLDQRFQSEEKEEVDNFVNTFIGKLGEDELERKPSPVYIPVVDDTFIANSELILADDKESFLSKSVTLTSRVGTSQCERRSRKRTRSLNSLQATCTATAIESPSRSALCISEVYNNSNSNLQQGAKLTRGDSKPPAKLIAQSGSANQPTWVSGSIRNGKNSVMAGGRRRYDDSDDENPPEYNSEWVPTKRNGGRHVLSMNGQVNLFLTPAENEPTIYNKRQDALSNHSASVSKSNRYLTESRDSNPVSFMAEYTLALKKMGLELVEQEGDGNCLFRAVSLQVYGHADHHAEVRERCMDFIASNEEHYSDFVAADSDEQSAEESFAAYVSRKRRNGVHGNHTEIQAISELFNRPVEVYTPDSLEGAVDGATNEFTFKPINIFQSDYKSSEFPIRLSYHDGNHYNAIIDPLVPTAGLGLGLPGLQPGLADKMQVAAAVTASDQIADQMELDRVLKESTVEHQKKSTEDENDDLQRAMKESTYSMNMLDEKKAIALSDLDATNFELEQEVLAYSWDSYSKQEHGRKQRAAPENATASDLQCRSSPGPVALTPYLPVYSERPSSVATAAAPASENFLSSPSPAATLSPVVASVASASMDDSSHFREEDGVTEYPQSVQELVVNGFDLKRVVRAYELVGENFDDMLDFLIATSSS